MNKFVPAIGESDFQLLREAGYGYVDKTSFVRDVLADSSKVLLFPRPRRFGKTLALSTLHHFLRKSDRDLSHLFAGLAVTRDAHAMRHFQKHPVVFVTFKDVKAKTFEDALLGIAKQVESACDANREVIAALPSGTGQTDRLRKLLAGTASKGDLETSLFDLSQALHAYHGERVVILIDEYDTPVQSGYANGFFDDVVGFFRNFFSSALKDNSSLFKAVMTGILRVSRENMFSGLNHIETHSIADEPYADAFGFTEEEVAAIVLPERLEEARSWYNGYLFGGRVIYNPWSILHFIKYEKLKPYWVNTGSSDLIEMLALKRGLGLSEQSEALLRGESIEVSIDSNIVLRDIELRKEAFWNFLLFSGYLKLVELKLEVGRYQGKLAIPNIEVKIVYEDLFRLWLEKADPHSGYIDALVSGLLKGDARTVQETLEHVLLAAMSYFDAGGDQPEKLYHGLMLGLLVHLEKQYDIRSNRESDFGRADMLMIPKTPGKPGVVLEFKVPDKRKSVDATLKDAAQQVRTRKYAMEVAAAGADPVFEYAIVFDGKEAWVKLVDDALAT